MAQHDKERADAYACPEPTLRRLPLYHQYLKRLSGRHEDYVSCTQIAQDLGLQPIQVRKDIEATGIVGRPRLGYAVSELRGAIGSYLGWDNDTDAFLVGAGNLGAALLGYQGFREYGLNIVAAFDADPAKAGTEIHGKKVMALSRLESLVGRMKVSIGILTVPGHAAQDTADLLVRAGIRGIWNFAPARVSVPAHVCVQHENLAASLAVLSNKIRCLKGAR